LGAALVLGIALWLEPSPAGHGTHEQLGLLRCNWIVLFDFPCPTCGMTTAFAHAVEGQFLASFLAQPAGLILAIATGIALLSGLYVLATGANLGGLFNRLATPRLAWIAFALLGIGWLVKILSVKELL
jgi:hypothetical protein